MTQAPKPDQAGTQSERRGSQAAPPASERKQRWHVISPLGLLVIAAAIAAVYGVEHALGWREHVSACYATSADSHGGLTKGLLYVGAYLGFTLAVPILAIAAALLAALTRLMPGKAGAPKA